MQDSPKKCGAKGGCKHFMTNRIHTASVLSHIVIHYVQVGVSGLEHAGDHQVIE